MRSLLLHWLLGVKFSTSGCLVQTNHTKVERPDLLALLIVTLSCESKVGSFKQGIEIMEQLNTIYTNEDSMDRLKELEIRCREQNLLSFPKTDDKVGPSKFQEVRCIEEMITKVLVYLEGEANRILEILEQILENEDSPPDNKGIAFGPLTEALFCLKVMMHVMDFFNLLSLQSPLNKKLKPFLSKSRSLFRKMMAKTTSSLQGIVRILEKNQTPGLLLTTGMIEKVSKMLTSLWDSFLSCPNTFKQICGDITESLRDFQDIFSKWLSSIFKSSLEEKEARKSQHLRQSRRRKSEDDFFDESDDEMEFADQTSRDGFEVEDSLMLSSKSENAHYHSAIKDCLICVAKLDLVLDITASRDNATESTTGKFANESGDTQKT